MRDDFDRGAKWLIQHHGDTILQLGQVAGIRAWRPLQAEVVLPRQLPDGLLEVELEGQDSPVLFIVEIGTFPEARLLEQVLRDQMLVYLDRRELPEVLTLILHPKGKFRITGSHDLSSRLGFSRLQAGWRVVELWTLPAEALLAANDVGSLGYR